MTAEDLAALPLEQQPLYENIPAWVTGAFAIAVFGGSLACILLLIRKKLFQRQRKDLGIQSLLLDQRLEKMELREQLLLRKILRRTPRLIYLQYKLEIHSWRNYCWKQQWNCPKRMRL